MLYLVCLIFFCLRSRLVPSSVGQALDSHYAQYATHITLFYQGKIAITGVNKEIQMSTYPSKGGLTCLLSNVVKKVGVRGCISWYTDLLKFWMAVV